jgi:hypothetical protein
MDDFGRRIVVSRLTEVSRTLSLNPLESFDAWVMGSGALLMPSESPVNIVWGSGADSEGNLEPEKKNAFRVTTMMPSKMRRSPITETTLANMDVLIGFTTGIEKTVNCPKA